ncbi:hypothetical protein BpHYR1_010311, partial [Brachionus plicatilis]
SLSANEIGKTNYRFTHLVIFLPLLTKNNAKTMLGSTVIQLCLELVNVHQIVTITLLLWLALKNKNKFPSKFKKRNLSPVFKILNAEEEL